MFFQILRILIIAFRVLRYYDLCFDVYPVQGRSRLLAGERPLAAATLLSMNILLVDEKTLVKFA